MEAAFGHVVSYAPSNSATNVQPTTHTHCTTVVPVLLQYFKWTAPADGYLTAAACSNLFQVALTVIGNGTDAEGEPVINGNLGCGGVPENCADPNLLDPEFALV